MTALKRDGDVAVLLVHGIGAQERGGTLKKQAGKGRGLAASRALELQQRRVHTRRGAP
jgi:hypothetical protein